MANAWLSTDHNQWTNTDADAWFGIGPNAWTDTDSDIWASTEADIWTPKAGAPSTETLNVWDALEMAEEVAFVYVGDGVHTEYKLLVNANQGLT